MIVWKFALYLGVITLLYALIVSIVAIARYGRGGQLDDQGLDVSGSDERQIPPAASH